MQVYIRPKKNYWAVVWPLTYKMCESVRQKLGHTNLFMSVQWFSKRNERTPFDLFLSDQCLQNCKSKLRSLKRLIDKDEYLLSSYLLELIKHIKKIITTFFPALNIVKGYLHQGTFSKALL